MLWIFPFFEVTRENWVQIFYKYYFQNKVLDRQKNVWSIIKKIFGTYLIEIKWTLIFVAKFGMGLITHIISHPDLTWSWKQPNDQELKAVLVDEGKSLISGTSCLCIYTRKGVSFVKHVPKRNKALHRDYGIGQFIMHFISTTEYSKNI